MSAQTAKRLLAQFGEPVTLSAPGTAGFDPITGAPVTPVAGDSYSGNGYPSAYKQTEIGGTIEAGDIRLVLELLEVRPEVNWTATVNSKTYRVMNVQPIRKSGADVLYVCQLRAN